MRLPILSTLAGLLSFLPVAKAAVSFKETAWNDKCFTESTVSCTFFDERGVKRSCNTLSTSLTKNTLASADVTPFIYVQKDKCQDKIIDATITMQVCNKKSETIITDTAKTIAYFEGTSVTGFDAVFDMNLPGGSCHTFEFQRRLDACKEEHTYTMAYRGVFQNSSFGCGNYQYLKSRLQLYDPPPNAPARIENKCVKYSDNGRLFDTSVSLSCTYEDENGETKSCVSQDNNTPFLKIQRDECGTIDATITMEMCNNIDSSASDDVINLFRSDVTKAEDDHARFKFSNMEYGPESLYADLSPGECRVIERQEQINTCKTQFPMSVRLAGNRPKQSLPSYVYCWIFRKSTIELFDPPPVEGPASPAPNPPPAPSPTVPAPAPTIQVATSTTTLLITEAVDLETGNINAPKLVELYTPNLDLHGGIWPVNYRLVAIRNGVYDWDNSKYLKGKEVDSKGFMTFCNAAAMDAFQDECDFWANTLVNSLEFGCDSIAIVQGNEESFTVIDMYGVTGNIGLCISKKHDFRDGRAERKIDATEPKTVWDVNDWIITPIASRWHIDADIWDNQDNDPICNPRDVLITEVADPAGASQARFVELYFEDCAGKMIPEDIRLVRYTGDSLVPGPPIHLIDEDVPADGLLTIFATNQGDVAYDDIIAGVDSAADVDGGDKVAVIDGPYSNGPVLLDVYGVPGQSGPNFPDYFKNGRAIRKKPSINSKIWIENEWIVYPGNDNKGEVPLSGCDPHEWINQIIITEVIDLQTGDENGEKFVELYVPNIAHHGLPIEDDLKLVVYKSGSSVPDWNSAIPLNSTTIQSDGFIVFCNEQASNVYGAQCDYVSGIEDGLLTTSDTLGCDSVAIVHENQNKFKIVDLFGVVGANCQDSNHDFSFGRAARLPGYSYAEVKWSPGHWSISTTAAPDPHRWVDSTNTAPVAPPVKNPSNKKSSKNNVPTSGVFPPSSAPVNSAPSASTSGIVTPSPAPVTTKSPTGKGGKGATTKSPSSTTKAPKGTKSPKLSKAPKETVSKKKAKKGSDPESTTLVSSQAEFLDNSSSSYYSTIVGTTFIVLGGWLFLFW